MTDRTNRDELIIRNAERARDRIRRSTVQLRNKALAALLNTPAYRRFRVFADAAHAAGVRRFPGVPAILQPGSALALSTRPKTQMDACIAAVEAAKRPLTIDELLRRLPFYGGRVRAKKARLNLGVNLSRDPRLVSVRVEGRYCWWLADTPLPSGKPAVSAVPPQR